MLEGQERAERFEFRELHMGVAVRLVLHARDDVSARAAAREAFDRIAGLEQMMSDYRPGSELRRLERRVGEPVRVSQELFEVLARAQQVAARSHGAFDPTAGPVVSLWREARHTRRLPTQRDVDSARALAGWRAIVLDSQATTVTITRPGVRLDLGGIAKGYIIQAALRRLRQHGITSALMEAGGDIVVGAAPPGKTGWRIEAPHADSATARRAASLSNACLSTSGPSGQSVEIEGVRYSHVVDPRSGRALASPGHSTVIATDCALADALATALTVMAPGHRVAMVSAFASDVVQWSVTRF